MKDPCAAAGTVNSPMSIGPLRKPLIASASRTIGQPPGMRSRATGCRHPERRPGDEVLLAAGAVHPPEHERRDHPAEPEDRPRRPDDLGAHAQPPEDQDRDGDLEHAAGKVEKRDRDGERPQRRVPNRVQQAPPGVAEDRAAAVDVRLWVGDVDRHDRAGDEHDADDRERCRAAPAARRSRRRRAGRSGWRRRSRSNRWRWRVPTAAPGRGAEAGFSAPRG